MMPLDKRLALLACAGLLAACERAEPDAEPAPTTTAADVSVLPVAEPPLDRAALLGAIAQATSDAALGRDDTQRQAVLDGRLFELRLRFGCEGAGEDARRWSFDETRRVLRISVEPEIAAQTPAIAGLGLAGFEAVEGFWIRRPWMLEAACQTAASGAGPETASSGAAVSDPAPEDDQKPDPLATAPRVGIAQFYTAQDSRLRRRDRRAYETTRQLVEGEALNRAGYDLVLSGRLTRLPNGKTISCVAYGRNEPPACIVAARFDKVSISRPDGEVLAEWSHG